MGDIDDFFESLGAEYQRGRSEETGTRASRASRARSRSVAPQTEFLAETLRNINGTLENLNASILTISQPQYQQQPPQPQQPVKTLSLSFEEYQNYLGRVSAINQYIREQIQKLDYIEADYINSIQTNTNTDSIIEIITNYNMNLDNFYSNYAIETLSDFLDNLDLKRLEIKPLPNINPEIKKREALKNLTLPGTNNVIFTKLKSDKKTSYDTVIGDYIRVDIPKAIPSKLRYNEKDPQNPFHVTQGVKTFVFNNIELAKNFCLSGGIQADFINAKNAIDFDKKYKNTYVPSYVYR